METKLPKGFQQVKKAMQNNEDPTSMLQQVMGSYTPEQKQALFKQCKNFGVPEQILAKIQNLK
jgi:hypothetical protein